MRFQTTLIQSGKTATDLQVPPEVVGRLGSGKRPAVSVTLRGHTYRSTFAPMGGVYMVPVSAEIRRITGVAGGDAVDAQAAHPSVGAGVRREADVAGSLLSTHVPGTCRAEVAREALGRDRCQPQTGPWNLSSAR
jgi:hypothetical protein